MHLSDPKTIADDDEPHARARQARGACGDPAQVGRHERMKSRNFARPHKAKSPALAGRAFEKEELSHLDPENRPVTPRPGCRPPPHRTRKRPGNSRAFSTFSTIDLPRHFSELLPASVNENMLCRIMSGGYGHRFGGDVWCFEKANPPRPSTWGVLKKTTVARADLGFVVGRHIAHGRCRQEYF